MPNYFVFRKLARAKAKQKSLKNLLGDKPRLIKTKNPKTKTTKYIVSYYKRLR